MPRQLTSSGLCWCVSCYMCDICPSLLILFLCWFFTCGRPGQNDMDDFARSAFLNSCNCKNCFFLHLKTNDSMKILIGLVSVFWCLCVTQPCHMHVLFCLMFILFFCCSVWVVYLFVSPGKRPPLIQGQPQPLELLMTKWVLCCVLVSVKLLWLRVIISSVLILNDSLPMCAVFL